MFERSLPSRLAEVGVRVLEGDAHRLVYRAAGDPIAVDVMRVGRLTGSAGVLSKRRSRPGQRLLVVCDGIADRAREALLEHGDIDLFDTVTGELVLEGHGYGAPARPPSRSSAARDRTRSAALRVCVLARDHLRQRDIASAVGVSQQAVSQMAAKQRLPSTPMTVEDRRASLAQLSGHPTGDSHAETYWYGLAPVVEQVRRVLTTAAELEVDARAGGEVAADWLNPWRVPTQGLVYARELIDLSVAQLVPATHAEATLVLRVPEDSTVWATARWWSDSTVDPAPPTVDPVVVLQDMVSRPGGDDGAPDRLREWIANRT